LRASFTILLFLFLPFVVHAQTNYKRDFVKALSSNDFPSIEKIISDNAEQLSDSDKRLMYTFTLDYCHKDSALSILKLLQNKNINPSLYDLFNAVNRNHSDDVVQFILDQDIKPNGEILLFAAEKKRFNLVNQFAKMGADVNYQYPDGSAYANGATALLYAINENVFDTVKILVEQGADVNVANKNGYTPASLSKEMKQAEIFDYLIANGAEDITVPQITDLASPQIASNVPASNSGQGIASLMDNKTLTLKSGTYRLSGGSAEIVIPANSLMGAFSYTSRGNPMMGAFRIEKNSLLIMMEGKNHTYNIDSESSFSGYGERWTRVGN
jgi:hypothetical protein